MRWALRVGLMVWACGACACGGDAFSMTSDGGDPSSMSPTTDAGPDALGENATELGSHVDAGATTPPTGCATDFDCKGSRVCVNGVCVDPPSGGGQDAGVPSTASDAGAPMADAEAGTCTTVDTSWCWQHQDASTTTPIVYCTQGRMPPGSCTPADAFWTLPVDPGTHAWCCPQ